MTDLTVENLFNQIMQLSPPERFELLSKLEPLVKPAKVENGLSVQPALAANGTTAKKKIEPIPVPDSKRELRWLKDHAREYAGQWVALDGDRLIAHGPDAKAVFAAARADGAYLPMITQVEDPDRPYILF